MLLITKTECLFDPYDRIVFTKPWRKPAASYLPWFHPLCYIMHRYFGLCSVLRRIREANYKEIHTVNGRLEFRKFSSHKLFSDSASFVLWASEAGKFANSTSRRLKVQFRFVVSLNFAFDLECVRCVAFCAFTHIQYFDWVRIKEREEFQIYHWRVTLHANEFETDLFAKVVLAERIICFKAIVEYFCFSVLQVVRHKVRQVLPVGDQKWFRDEGQESNLSHRLFSLHRLQ